MRIEYALGAVAPFGDAVLTIGAFDGVHLGHRRLVERTAELARERGARAVAITFWPHPLAVLRPQEQVALLSTLDEKIALIAGMELLDGVVVVPFTPELAASEPGVFLDMLRAWSSPRAFVEGPDFAFGRDRAGDLAYLRAAGARLGFDVERIEVTDDGERVSSTRIRRLVREGQVTAAARLLGQPYRVTGAVTLGDQRGRLLGFPTANIQPDARKALPANGVYAVRVALPGETTARHPGVANIGVRPTVSSEPKLLVEVHLLDAAMDLYGLTLGVDIIERLRDERRFDGVEALRAQIDRDARTARELLAGRTDDRSEESWAC
ncbi:MAG TPA: bifunctional riboflavin kinase/FAD synthetase [Ktedonobacterales bacterium]|nr:bifunctional riboflavin kinase/FAD synthetase [Ktedonobacterales bacterium]